MAQPFDPLAFRRLLIGAAKPPGDGGGSGPAPTSGSGGVVTTTPSGPTYPTPVAAAQGTAATTARLPGADSPDQGGDATAAALGVRGGGAYHGPNGSLSDIFPGWLNSDPEYQQALAQVNAAANSDRAAMKQAANQLMIQYGITPDLEKAGGQLGLGGGPLAQLLATLDPATARAAAQNSAQGTSILGGLTDKNNVANQSIGGDLAARGMSGSSDAGFRYGQENLAYNQGIYNALSRMLNTYTSDEQRLTSQLAGLYGSGGTLQKAMEQAWSNFLKALGSGQVVLPSGVTAQQVAAAGPGSVPAPSAAPNG